jgi:diguanylate cyclase (GGDEF)-like protein
MKAHVTEVSARRWWRMSIAVSLAALICIPTAGLVGVSTATAVARRENAGQAAEVRRSADHLQILTRARFVLQREYVASAVLAAGREWGVDSATIGEILGFDPGERIDTAREEVDRLVADLDPRSDVGQALSGVGDLRRLVDASAIGFQDVIGQYGAVETFLSGAVDDVIAELRAARAAMADMTGIDESVRELDATVAVHETTVTELSLLSDVLVSGVEGGDDTILRLAGELALHDQATQNLDAVATGAVRSMWHQIRADESAVRFDEAMDGLWRTAHEGGFGPVADNGTAHLALAPTFADGLRTTELTLDLISVGANDLARKAEQAETLAQSTFARDLLTVALLVLVTAIAGLFTARSITRPLRRLAKQASAVSDGSLAVPQLHESGPTEVAVVTRAFNDVVANLRAVESQASALAAGKLDDPALDLRLKGSLAIAVQGSVTRLSRSLSERDELQRRLAHEATHDALTGLANRALFNDRIEHALARHARDGEDVAIVYCDLDGFKTINDSLGHDAGDKLLCIAAERLTSAVRQGDTIARLGGDEFAVLLEGPPGLVAEAVAVSDRILRALSDPVEVNGVPMVVTASVGVAAASQGAGSADELLRDADAAMYQAKRTGRDRLVVFEAGMMAEALARIEVERDMVGVVDRGELVVHYQPVVHLESGELRGFEALVRWQHPTRGLLLPASFIPVAEETGRIVEIGDWVLRTACETARTWQRPDGRDPISVAVNLSARQLDDGTFLDRVATILEETGVDPKLLVLELTESIIVARPEEVAVQLRALKELGVTIAIDDFGTGYSSLSYLRQFPVDVLKIDRSFIESIADGERGHALVRGLLDLARTLGIGALAEGIEQSVQLDSLVGEGCEFGQGFLFARPLDGTAAAEIAAEFHARTPVEYGDTVAGSAHSL